MVQSKWLSMMMGGVLFIATTAAAAVSVNWSVSSTTPTPAPTPTTESTNDDVPGAIKAANLIYAGNKTSKCFSSEFMKALQQETGIPTSNKFDQVKLVSTKMYRYPFAVMSGEGSFAFTAAERESFHNYLTRGGFLVASPGCSSKPWRMSFKKEVALAFPKLKLKKIQLDHPIYHTIYDIKELKTKRRMAEPVLLEGLEIDGKIVLVFSPEGLNDTGKAGGNCCCCGGNEILNARNVNVNLLAYALTH